MALFLLSANLGWVQGHFNFTETSLRYRAVSQGQLESNIKLLKPRNEHRQYDPN